jgi:hypothetical protein
MTDPQNAHVNTAASGQLRVFVNYRRGDTRHVAGRLRDLIVARFGEESVFVDVESIEPGLDYVSAIDKAVASCDVMLVLIGEGWLQASGDQGLRRIDDQTDRLRLEIEAGLKHRTRVIPVLVDSASMPKSKNLPPSIEGLARHQATRLRHESFRSDADYLLNAVERVAAGHDPLPPRTRTRTPTGTPTGTPIGTPTGDATQRMVRWVSCGLLVAVLLALLAFRSDVREPLLESRADLPPDGPWASMLWMLPALPVVIAAWLVSSRKRPGVALGSIAGAAVWVFLSLVFIVWRERDPAVLAHLTVLVLLLASTAGMLVAVPETREPVRANRGSRAFLACMLVVAAVVLRAQSSRITSVITSADSGQTDWAQLLTRPPFWIATLVPVLICLPAALLLFNRVQVTALVAMVSLQILYPAALRAMSFSERMDEGVAPVITNDLVFLAGSVCMLLAVRVGQHRSAAPS